MDDYVDFNNISELEDEFIDFHEPTPEEIEQIKKERKEEIERKGFLPENDELEESMTSPQEMVEKNPRKFIIEECIPACEELWSKNIYTFMVSNHLNEGECWIEIVEDSLSDENKEIYMGLLGDDVEKFRYHEGTVNFGVKKVGLEGQERLLELAKKFQMQDVPKDQAYITIEKFLMDYYDCYDEIDNQDYREMKAPWESGLPLEELRDYMNEYSKWEDSIESQKKIRIFNPGKVTKTIEELVDEKEMIMEYDRVYLSKFHYDKHKKYLIYLDTIKDNEEENTGHFRR